MPIPIRLEFDQLLLPPHLLDMFHRPYTGRMSHELPQRSDRPSSRFQKLVPLLIITCFLSLAAQGADEFGQSRSNWWSLQPIVRRELPPVTNQSRILSPIDAFIESKLEEHGLTLGPEADRRTLIRRLKFDLHGLPPTPQELDAFINDRASDAYTRLVDRLLDSPRYGERWARHWLDVVRFAESKGYERDRIRENAWHYRDWVIQAFNDDMPYGDFVCEQLAGDAIRPCDGASAVPTGFLVTGP